MFLLRQQARLVFVDGRVALREPPLRDQTQVAPLGFFNQVGAFDNEPVEIIRDARVDLFFLTHD